MSLTAQHGNETFGVGDKVRVIQKFEEKGKQRTQTFEGWVIAIRGRQENKSFTVRRIGYWQVGIEKIFPLASPTIDKILVLKKGTEGVRRSKLYFTRKMGKGQIDKIYSRASRKNLSQALEIKK